jgi:hypothetical protein
MDVKEFYICHYCASYITSSRKDIKNHFERKNICKCMTLYSYEESKILSLSKKFIILVDIDKLILDDYLYIINNYNNKKNYILPHFKEDNTNKEISKESIKENIKREIEEFKKSLNEDIYNIIDSENESDICSDEEDKKMNNIKNKKTLNNIEFKKKYFNSETNKYVCPDCLIDYTTKFYLVKHLKNKKACEENQQMNILLAKSTEITKINKEKELKQNEEIKKHITQNIGTQNINIQNNNSNTNNNTYNLLIKDFVHDNYDITHIKDSFYQKKDFFLYHNFLRVIMENKKNHNIFFTNNEAIIYTDKELNKMNSDKAGYLLLDKLSKSFEQLIHKQDIEVQEYYAFITKYYNVVKGQYKHDTIFKDYDVEERRFVYTANSGMFRSRDKYLCKMVSTVKSCDADVREKLLLQGQNIKDIPLINPSIEDFASAKMRYRDLKDKD